jgi:hypothetical protein
MLGYLGIAIGVFFVLPILPISPVLQILYQACLALIFFNFWMGPIPRAWETGEAEVIEPAPRRGGLRGAPAAPEPAPAPAVPARTSARKKRKKR